MKYQNRRTIFFLTLIIGILFLSTAVTSAPLSDYRRDSDYSSNLADNEIICNNVTGKCPGSMLKTNGQISIPVPPKTIEKGKTEDECQADCIKTPWCLMAVYLVKSRKHKTPACHLYDRVGFVPGGTNNTIFHWVCCQSFTSPIPCADVSEDRCSGAWLPASTTNLDLVAQGQSRSSKIELFPQISLDICKKVCLLVPKCSITIYNIEHGLCELHRDKFVPETGYSTDRIPRLVEARVNIVDRWICCPNPQSNVPTKPATTSQLFQKIIRSGFHNTMKSPMSSKMAVLFPAMSAYSNENGKYINL